MKVIKRYSGIGGGVQLPTRLIIHSMSEIIDDKHASAFLQGVKLSAHFLIEVNGDVMKLRKTHEVAWHARSHNTNSIGIEVLVKGEHTYQSFLDDIQTDWVFHEQYDSLIELSKNIQEYYDISKEDVVRHSDIDPGRKFDPGTGFDWDHLQKHLL